MVTSISTFLSTGFGHVLADDFAGPPDDLSKLLCAQLANACHGGHAEWLATQHQKTMDGNAAWRSLNRWCSRKSVRSKVTASHRNEIHAARLIPGATPGKHINSAKGGKGIAVGVRTRGKTTQVSFAENWRKEMALSWIGRPFTNGLGNTLDFTLAMQKN